MKLIRLSISALAACAVLLSAVPVAAEPVPLAQKNVAFQLDSGTHRNTGSEPRVVFETVIRTDSAPWVRLIFSTAELAPGSVLELTSMQDGARQTLDAIGMGQWHNSSAYFNGSEVQLRLIAGNEGGTNRIIMDEILVGEWAQSTESQCGPTDDRVPSSEPERARLLSIGCTASIYSEQSCFITAGHCMTSPSTSSVVEFNVPPSLFNGTIQHPPPEDQYSVTTDRVSVNGGLGNDWGLFKTFPNSQTGLTAFEAQGAIVTLADSLPPGTSLPTPIEIVGYGVDSGTRNQTQQVHSGPMISITGTRLNYQADTEGGNSGSAVILESSNQMIGVHTNGGCGISGGSNSGTAITNANLQAELATFCATGGAIPCGDVFRFNARCTVNGALQAWVVFTDSSHSGQTVTFGVDGSDVTRTINNRFSFVSQPAASGAHTISLEDPAACVAPVTVSCP